MTHVQGGEGCASEVLYRQKGQCHIKREGRNLQLNACKTNTEQVDVGRNDQRIRVANFQDKPTIINKAQGTLKCHIGHSLAANIMTKLDYQPWLQLWRIYQYVKGCIEPGAVLGIGDKSRYNRLSGLLRHQPENQRPGIQTDINQSQRPRLTKTTGSRNDRRKAVRLYGTSSNVVGSRITVKQTPVHRNIGIINTRPGGQGTTADKGEALFRATLPYLATKIGIRDHTAGTFQSQPQMIWRCLYAAAWQHHGTLFSVIHSRIAIDIRHRQSPQADQGVAVCLTSGDKVVDHIRAALARSRRGITGLRYLPGLQGGAIRRADCVDTTIRVVRYRP